MATGQAERQQKERYRDPYPEQFLVNLREMEGRGLFTLEAIVVESKDHKQALLTALALCGLALFLGLVGNHFRRPSLPLFRELPALMEGDVSVDEAFALYGQDAAVFVDARPWKAYRRAHIPGALPFSEREIPEGLPVVTYCSNRLCPKAQDLAEELRALGYPVLVMHQGIQEWSDRGFPLKEGEHP